MTNVKNVKITKEISLVRLSYRVSRKTKNEVISIDHYGPIPTAVGGVKYILVVVDNFIKTALRKPKMYFEEFGVPKPVYTDNGTHFTLKRWKQERKAIIDGDTKPEE